MRCKNCNNELVEGVKFCNKCGTPVEEVKNDNNINNQVVMNKEDNKKNNNIVLFIVVGVICFLVGACGGFLIGKNVTTKTEDVVQKNEELKTEEKETPTKTDYIRKPIDLDSLNISLEGDLGKGLEILAKDYDEKYYSLSLLVKNNNNVPIEINGDFNYLDSTGQRVGRTYDTEYINAGKISVIEFSYLTKEEHSTVAVILSAKKPGSYYHFLDINEKGLNETDDGKDITIQYLNTTNEELSTHITGIFYKDNKIIGFEKGYALIKPNMTGNVQISYFKLPGHKYENNYKDVADRYELSVSGVYYYDKVY